MIVREDVESQISADRRVSSLTNDDFRLKNDIA